MEIIDTETGEWNDVPLSHPEDHGYICQYDTKHKKHVIPPITEELQNVDQVGEMSANDKIFNKHENHVDTHVCDEDWMFLLSTVMCYRFVDNKTTWSEARAACEHMSPKVKGDLASVPDNETNIFLTSLTTKKAYIGGMKNDEEQWVWSDGRDWSFELWAPDQPSDSNDGEDFLEILDPLKGNWNDVPDDHPEDEVGFICQYDPKLDNKKETEKKEVETHVEKEVITKEKKEIEENENDDEEMEETVEDDVEDDDEATKTTTVKENSSNCIENWSFYKANGKCYMFVDENINWDEARESCKQLSPNENGDLASVPDKETNSFIVDMAPKKALIGGMKDREGNWRWVDGSEWGFEPWAEGQPSDSEAKEDFLEILEPDEPVKGRWNDVPLDHPGDNVGFICQYDPDGKPRTEEEDIEESKTEENIKKEKVHHEKSVKSEKKLEAVNSKVQGITFLKSFLPLHILYV